MNKDEVHKIEIFAGLTPAQVDEMYTWMQLRDFHAGTEIIKAGNLPNGLYVLTGGKVAVLKTSEMGKVKLTDISAPSFFGEIGLLNGNARTACVRAETPVVVGYLPKQLFDTKLAENNLTALRISLNIGRILCTRLCNTSDLLASTALLAAHRDGTMIKPK
jgi:CRP-like cAMP-binding protein